MVTGELVYRGEVRGMPRFTARLSPTAKVSKDVQSLEVGVEAATIDVPSSHGHAHTAWVGVDRCYVL